MDILKNIGAINNKATFYRAVVEDREDPEFLNRCRVRILGIHTDDDSKVPVETLPWAEMAPPSMYGGQNAGIGLSSVPLLGTWVWVFMDAGDWNRPIIFATMYGIPSKNTDVVKGFLDPDGEHPVIDRLGEPDTNRFANQNKFDETLINTIKKANIDLATPTATAEQWDELEEMTSSAVYPDNHVIETITGNIVEFDDTEGNSRMHWFHNSGTYWEVVNEGDYTMKVVQDRYEIVDRDVKRLVKRDETHTIQGNQEYKIDGWQEILIEDFSHEVINGYVFQEYADYLHITVKDYVKEEYDSTFDTTVTDAVTEIYNATQDTTVADAVTEIYKGTQDTTVTDAVTETYNATFDTTVQKAVSQTYNDTFDLSVIGDTSETFSGDYTKSVIGATSITYSDTFDLSVIGAVTETYADAREITSLGDVTTSTVGATENAYVGAVKNSYVGGITEESVGPASYTWALTGEMTAGTQITVKAPVIMLN